MLHEDGNGIEEDIHVKIVSPLRAFDQHRTFCLIQALGIKPAWFAPLSYKLLCSQPSPLGACWMLLQSKGVTFDHDMFDVVVPLLTHTSSRAIDLCILYSKKSSHWMNV